MAYNKNLNIGPNNVVNISGSLVTITGSVYGTEISGTTAQFTLVSASIVSASQYIGLPTLSGGSGSPGGADTNIQFNKAGAFSGSSNLVYNYNTNTLSGTTAQFTTITASHISGTDLKIDYIDFNTTAVNPTFQTGRIHFNTDNGDLAYDTNVAGVYLNYGQQLAVKVKNNTGATIAKGKLVAISGGLGNNPTIVTASWDNEKLSADTIGMMMNAANPNDFAYVLLNGVIEDVNTSGSTGGTALYLSSSGDYTSNVPVPPNQAVRIGHVVREHQNQGSIFIRVQNGYEINELHDVLVSSSANGDLLVWDSSVNLWKNSKILSGSYQISGNLTVTGSTTISTISGTTAQFTNITGSGLYISGNVGIGTTTPTETLHIKKAESVYLQIENSSTGGYSSILSKNDIGSYVQLFSVASNQIGTWFNNDDTPLDRKNTVGFRTGGSETALVFAAQGNVPLQIGQNDTTRLYIGTSEAVFNRNKLNYDFRVAGDNQDNVVFVKASTDRVGINTSNPNSTLDVNGNTIISGNLTVTGSTTLSTVSGTTAQFTTVSSSNLSISNTASFGTTSPQAGFHFVSTAPENPNPYGDLLFEKENGWLLYLNQVHSNASNALVHSPQFILQKGRGTKASPAAVQNGDQIGGFFYRAYDGGTYQQRAGISAWVDGTPTINSDVPMKIRMFAGTQAGADTDERFSIARNEIVVNQFAQDVDFRIEGTSSINLFVTDAGLDRVGINKSSPNSTLDINGNTIISGSLTVTGSIFVSGSSIYGQVAELTSSTSNYTLVRQDSGKFLNINSGSAVTVTVPTGLPTGFTVSLCQLGAGQVTVSGAVGVTINNRQNHTKTAGQYSVVSLVGTSADTYVFVGDTSL